MLRNCPRHFLKPIVSTFKVPNRDFTPRRALLYVPAHDLKKVLKAFTLDVDCIMLDCEDGVALNKKAQARLNIREMLDKGKPSKKRKYDFGVRVNSVSSGILKDDLAVIFTGKSIPDTILLPKVESNNDLQLFSDYLNEFVTVKEKISLIMGIESAISLVKSVDICKTARELSEAPNNKFLPKALLFGSDDFCASIGARRTDSSSEIIYARQKVVTVAKAFNLSAIDMVYINYQDKEGLKKQADEGARLGYTGKQIIHPGQVEVVQEAFFPAESQIEWAKNILKAFHKHQQEGEGAFTYKGQMIDMPTMRQAQNIMDLVNILMMQQ